jgi:LDH2 family malate/lactate/ureidoglycolate dehydrogenase
MIKNLPASQIRRQIETILAAWGMPEDLIKTTADIMVDTDLSGVDSHGISMLMTYERMLHQGRLNITGRPEIVRETAIMAHINGNAGLGHPVSAMGMRLAVDKAKAAGIGVVTANNSHHFGAAGCYARMAADAGCIGIVTSTARGVTVVPTGGRRPVLGTNPIAIAAPARRNPPFVLDMATSSVAVGKVKVFSFYDRPLPEGWMIDGDGKPMRNATEGFALLQGAKAGGLTPIGGTRELGSHKGYGLGLVAQILAGALGGGAFSPIRDKTGKESDPYNIGHFFLAIDPTHFRDAGAFESELDDIVDYLHAEPPADAAQPVLVAGDPEVATRARRLEDGIPIPQALANQLRAVADRAKVAYIL